jgi:hypothetical protein
MRFAADPVARPSPQVARRQDDKDVRSAQHAAPHHSVRHARPGEAARASSRVWHSLTALQNDLSEFYAMVRSYAACAA